MNTVTRTGRGRLRLTAAELPVVDLASLGKTNTEIGTALGISPCTVKGHLLRIGRRAGSGTREGIVGLALIDGYFPRPAPTPGAPRPHVTRRQHEVLRLIARGKSTEGICAELFISEDTVKIHVRNLFAAFAVHNRAHLVRRAYETGVLEIVRTGEPRKARYAQ